MTDIQLGLKHQKELTVNDEKERARERKGKVLRKTEIQREKCRIAHWKDVDGMSLLNEFELTDIQTVLIPLTM